MATVAKESSQVVRARRKIKQMLAEEESKVTPEAIKEAASVIRNWIERHSEERIPLKNKNIAVSTSDVKSKYVIHLMQKLNEPKKPKPGKKLGGRVTSAPS